MVTLAQLLKMPMTTAAERQHFRMCLGLYAMDCPNDIAPDALLAKIREGIRLERT